MSEREIPVFHDDARTTATLTWWQHGWQSYALRLEGPFGVVEAVEDTWFTALSTVLPQLTPWRLDLPELPQDLAEDHKGHWLAWLDGHR